jgi:hypothetical protein
MIGRQAGRPDLLVRRDELDERRRRTSEAVIGREHEGVHHEPGLHVGHPRPIGAAILDSEGPAARLALREHGIAVAEQHDGFVSPAGPGDLGRDCIAVDVARVNGHPDALALEVAAEAFARGIHARLVIAAGIDVHDLLQKREHRALLLGQPIEDGARGFGHGGLR